MAQLDELVRRAGSLGAHPDALALLIGIMDDPMVDAHSLVPIVECDPGLTAGLLRLCNSSLYNYQRRIGTVREALVLVGNLTFARLCFALSLEAVLRRDLPGYALDTDTLWKHSLVTAYGSASLVMAMGLRNQRDRAFTAGLLHDIGKLVLEPELAARRPAPAADVPVTEPGDAHPCDDAAGGIVSLGCERLLTGYDHAEAGGALLDSWGLPPAICEAVRWHHVPELAGEHERLAEAVHYAERISHFAGDLRGAAASIDEWVADTMEAALVPVEAARRLVGSVLTRQGNLLALAAGPIG
ncbi:MAG TPA: HDOD domain-containing protein [Candidatus Krumholzibacteria bacterium]|nr:HDOD domain-containing protein [Candidatus Krumholzibacteria bacterium]